MSRTRTLVEAKDHQIMNLMIALGLSFVVTIAAIVGWVRAAQDITVHVPPSLERGATLRAGEVPDPNIHAFADMLWSLVNHWANDGQDDYPKNIEAYRAYFTPECQNWLRDNYEEKNRAAELRGRKRYVQLMPSGFYKEEKVRKQADGVWLVDLDMHIEEKYDGVTVKDYKARYPLRVVSYSIARELNPYGLAIDCFYAKPYALVDDGNGKDL